jgi:hypothetical protein
MDEKSSLSKTFTQTHLGPPTCQLEEYFITRLHMDFIPSEEEPEQPPVSQVATQADYDMALHNADPTRYRMHFRLSIHPINEPQPGEHRLLLDAEVIGFLKINERVAPDHRDSSARLNGVNLLYGVLRGVLGTVTGLSPAGKRSIASINPWAVVEVVERRKAAALAKAESQTEQTEPVTAET